MKAMVLWLIQGFWLGLAVSPTCLGVCFPLLFPYFCSEERLSAANIKALAWFLFGRFLGYAAIGVLAGRLSHVWMASQSTHQGLQGLVYSALGLVLIIYGVTRSFPHWPFCRWLLPAVGRVKVPIWLGFLTGINICPPFIAALFQAFQAGGSAQGFMVFMGFFAGTSIILLPMAGLGFLARTEVLRQAGRIAAVFIGLWFLIEGIFILS